eukprot:2631380-Amphidinium_carterae.1
MKNAKSKHKNCKGRARKALTLWLPLHDWDPWHVQSISNKIRKEVPNKQIEIEDSPRETKRASNSLDIADDLIEIHL